MGLKKRQSLSKPASSGGGVKKAPPMSFAQELALKMKK